MTLRQFLLRRVLLVIPILFGITFITFMLVRVGDRDPVAMLAGPLADRQTLATLRTEMGLDRSFWEQFAIYVGKLIQLDFGKSWESNNPVIVDIANRLPASLELLLIAMLIGAAVGIPVGLRSAQRPNGAFDQAARFVSLLGFSVPTYWFALMGIFIFFFKLGWAPPPMGRIGLDAIPPPDVTGSYFIDSLLVADWSAVHSSGTRLVLPVLIFSVIVAAPIIKHTRAIALEVLSSDYIRYARASGLSPFTVRRIALRNAFTPVLTFVASELTGLLAAVSLLEFIFAWGGMGQWGLNAILNSDFAAVQGYVLTLALFSAVIYVMVDIAVLMLEPRSALKA
ncbi:MAG: ABC transporter permease [Alphaproteobacteria bacterium]|nr:ABC transporter permease [Alphaproteobacteria bacterium]